MTYQEFGKEICTFKPSIFKAIIWTFVAILPVFLAIQYFQKFKSITALLIGFAFCLPAIYSYIVAVINRIEFFEKAVISKSIFGTKVLPLDGKTKIYISQVMASSLNIPVSRKIDVVLRNQNQLISISETKRKLEQALQHLELVQHKVIMPYLVEEFRKNRQIDFGAIKLTKKGVSLRNKDFHWQQVSGFTLVKNRLFLKDRDGSRLSNANNSIDITSIANPKLCFAFLSKLSTIQYK